MTKGFPEKLHNVETIVKDILENTRLSIGEEEVSVGVEALGRISSRDVKAVMDIPSFDRSLLDGYAARADDIVYASPESPVSLKIVSKSKGEIGSKECIELNTGEPIPRGADVIIPYEYTSRSDGTVYVYRSFPSGYGVGLKGEDVRRGDVIIHRGERIRPWHMALMSSQGLPRVHVYRRLRAAVFSTGEEILEPGQPYVDGKIYDSTRRLVLAYLAEIGLKVSDEGLLGDNEDEIYLKFRGLLRDYDIVFSIGGTSLGRRDYTVKALKRLNPRPFYHGFAIKPGRPGAIGIVDGKIVMALSGFPVAALSELELVFKPIIEQMYNTRLNYPLVRAKLTKRVPSQPGILELYRVRLWVEDDEYLVEPLRLTGSGVLSTLIRGNGLLKVPEDSTGFEAGDYVWVEIIDPHKLLPAHG